MSEGKVFMQTTPIDARFPNTNQAPHCWTRYNEWILCLKKNDGDEETCRKFRAMSDSICPNEWSEKWDEEREGGNFAGVKYP